MKTFYVPSTKLELIDWLSNFYGRKDPRYSKMAKKQLYAIYYSIRSSVNEEYSPTRKDKICA